MKILMTGSSGLVGNALRLAWKSRGVEVCRLLRGKGTAESGVFFWDPSANVIDRASMEGVDVVVNLAGENVAGGRWTQARKRLIRESRIQSTQLLARAFKEAKQTPKLFVSASAIGVYGDAGEGWVTEDSPAGKGFLAQVCVDWEAAAHPLVAAGVRCVFLRFGIVLSPQGGALSRMLPLFRMGLGGVLGRGTQWTSWVGMEDLIAAVDHVIRDETLRGAINVVAPTPVTNREFTQALSRKLRRPAVLPAPSWALRLAFGDMADEALLSSCRARPQRLLQSGFTFQQSQLEGWMRSTQLT